MKVIIQLETVMLASRQCFNGEVLVRQYLLTVLTLTPVLMVVMRDSEKL